MTRRRTHLFATAALTVATAFAASTALAIAESNDSMNLRDPSANAQSPSEQGLSAPDQAADSQSLNPSSDRDEGAMDSQDSSSDADMSSKDDSGSDQGMDSNDDSSSDERSNSSDDTSNPDVDSRGASAAGISSTQASSTTTLGSSGSQIAETPSANATRASADALVTQPVYVTRTQPVYVFPPDQPRYTPETGDAQYGSKLDPTGPSANRFNDATGQ
jgi:hypothetical protein